MRRPARWWPGRSRWWRPDQPHQRRGQGKQGTPLCLLLRQGGAFRRCRRAPVHRCQRRHGTARRRSSRLRRSVFDNYQRHPDNARLGEWLDLEPGDGPADADAQAKILRPKIDEIRRGQEAGHIDPAWDPVELLILIIEMTKSMAAPNPVLRELGRANHRDAATSARQAAVEAQGHGKVVN